jgi:hypothetical protein
MAGSGFCIEVFIFRFLQTYFSFSSGASRRYFLMQGDIVFFCVIAPKIKKKRFSLAIYGH